MCLQGATRVVAALADVPGERLRIHIAWAPMLPPDILDAAEAAARAFPRATQYWDGERRLAAEMGQALGITRKESSGIENAGQGVAWDVYLAYGPGDGDIFKPRFWMHQLGVEHAPRLDADEFRRRVGQLLS